MAQKYNRGFEGVSTLRRAPVARVCRRRAKTPRGPLARPAQPDYRLRMTSRSTFAWFGSAIFALAIAGCAGPRPDLLQVYPAAAQIERRPVIIIPGVFGSRLRDSRNGEVVWGRFTNFLTSRFKLILDPEHASETDLLDLPIDDTDITQNKDHLEAYDLFDGVAGREFYREIVGTLTNVAGYRLGDVKHPQRGEDCFAFYYDWRRDTVENARLLGEGIARVREVTGSPKVDP